MDHGRRSFRLDKWRRGHVRVAFVVYPAVSMIEVLWRSPIPYEPQLSAPGERRLTACAAAGMAVTVAIVWSTALAVIVVLSVIKAGVVIVEGVSTSG